MKNVEQTNKRNIEYFNKFKRIRYSIEWPESMGVKLIDKYCFVSQFLLCFSFVFSVVYWR